LAEIGATDVPFREQAEFWRRKVNVPTATWRDLQRGDHAHGFMVAGAARVDLLDDLRKAVDRAVLDGATIEDFRRDFDAIVARTGWDYKGGRNWRTRIIYTTNLRSSYQAGRWAQIQAIKHRRPYLQYIHNDSVKHPRPDHLAWHGVILRADDPWWDTHYGPNGYGCQCTARTLAERDLRRMGKDGPDEAPTPPDDIAGIDPGFDYNVGMAAGSMPAAVRLGERVMQLPPSWRRIALADAQQRPTDLFADWPATVARVLEEQAQGRAYPQGMAHPLGFLRPATVQALEAGIDAGGRAFAAPAPATALLGAVDNQLHHALRSIKEARGTIAAQLNNLPRWLADPETAVLWDVGEGGQSTQQPVLIFARRLGDGRVIKLVFQLDVRDKSHRALRRERLASNWLRTISVVSEVSLASANYRWLERFK